MAVSSFTLLMTFITTPAFSLDWNDEEWAQAGCPKGVIGTWHPQDPQSKWGTLTIREGALLCVQSQSGGEKLSTREWVRQYTFDDSTLAIDQKFIKLALHSVKEENYQDYIVKIRPHLVGLPAGQWANNSSSSDCLIKVFKFKSQEEAKFNKYLDWATYRLKK
tara:strand:+ start:62 stop:550 length:489 start_codon:yes stop_codon:yes gene_type:complete